MDTHEIVTTKVHSGSASDPREYEWFNAGRTRARHSHSTQRCSVSGKGHTRLRIRIPVTSASIVVSFVDNDRLESH